jgi:hypothetical protein
LAFWSIADRIRLGQSWLKAELAAQAGEVLDRLLAIDGLVVDEGCADGQTRVI